MDHGDSPARDTSVAKSEDRQDQKSMESSRSTSNQSLSHRSTSPIQQPLMLPDTKGQPSHATTSSFESGETRPFSTTTSSGAHPESMTTRKYFGRKRALKVEQHFPSEEEVSKARLQMMIMNDKAWRESRRNRNLLLKSLDMDLSGGKLSMINLTRRNIGPSEARVLVHAIERNKNLLVLKLSYNYLGDEGVSILANAIARDGKQHASLSVLDLGFNGIGDEGCGVLADRVLTGSITLQSLYLSGNKIADRGALSIAAAIFQGTSLDALHLSLNRIGDEGIQAIAGAIKTAGLDTSRSPRPCMISRLSLDSMTVSPDTFLSIPDMLLSFSRISFLNLSNTGLDDSSMLALAQAFTQNKAIPLEDLYLSFNQISCEGVESLMNALWGSGCLKRLRVDNNRLQDRGAQLCAVSLTSIRLELLDIGFNRVTPVGIKALMKNVSENDSLQSLCLSGIPIDQASAKALSFGLAYNYSLRNLYMDSCSAGYSAQRHIVAGLVSNRQLSLRNLTGFDVGPIASTLGVPQLPQNWNNEQVLGFFRLMWQQWMLKSTKGASTMDKNQFRGPAPPAAVASAAKIAFASLGHQPESLFRCDIFDKSLSERPPVDPPNASLMERSLSGTICVPELAVQLGKEIDGSATNIKHTEYSSPRGVLPTRSPLEDPEKRNRNLKILSHHSRALNEIARLPFNNADLWQLHQYFFSPTYQPTGEDSSNSNSEHEASSQPSNRQIVNDQISFQMVCDALAAEKSEPPGDSSELPSHKRRADNDNEDGDPDEPSAKRSKFLNPRIAYYPRIMDRIQSSGNRPLDQALSLLRQLKYIESIIFLGKDPYADLTDKEKFSDIEMILLDLL